MKRPLVARGRPIDLLLQCPLPGGRDARLCDLNGRQPERALVAVSGPAAFETGTAESCRWFGIDPAAYSASSLVENRPECTRSRFPSATPAVACSPLQLRADVDPY